MSETEIIELIGGVEVDGLPKLQTLVYFPNGWGASIIAGPGAYGARSLYDVIVNPTWEVAAFEHSGGVRQPHYLCQWDHLYTAENHRLGSEVYLLLEELSERPIRSQIRDWECNRCSSTGEWCGHCDNRGGL